MKVFKVRYWVQWVDTDSAKVMHFSNYFRYFEFAETELYRELGFDYEYNREKFGIWLPRVEAHCNYKSPCKFNDEIEVELWIEELGNKHIKYGFRINNLTENTVAAEGWVVIVAASISERRAVEIPDEIKNKLVSYFDLNIK